MSIRINIKIKYTIINMLINGVKKSTKNHLKVFTAIKVVNKTERIMIYTDFLKVIFTDTPKPILNLY